MSTPASSGQEIAAQVIDRALQDQNFASQLLSDPAAVFKQGGLDIPGGREAEFNENFSKIAPDLVATLNAPSRARPNNPESNFGIGCTACMIAAEVVAAAIVAVGAAGLAELTEGSAVVASVAAFLKIDAKAALAFVKSLAKDVVDGVSAVAKKLCQFVGSC